MSIVSAVSSKSQNKLVIPCAGKMFRSSIPNNDKALCFVLNKGYLETSSLGSMLSLLDDIDLIKDVILVGKIEKVRLRRTGIIVYRQRIFFKSLGVILRFCKMSGLNFELSRDFHITINNVLNCLDDLVYLERYARRFDEPIDAWLTHCCVIELHFYLKSLNMKSNLGSLVDMYLRNKTDYLSRAPFLISSYSIDNKSSGIFLGFSLNDTRLFASRKSGVDLLEVGYTEKNVKKDKKEGVFK